MNGLKKEEQLIKKNFLKTMIILNKTEFIG